MASHRSKVMWWQCVENTFGTQKFRRWILYVGHPDDKDSEAYFEFPEKEYRPVIKSLPPFKAGAIFPARMTFTPAKAPKRKKKEDEK